MTYVSIAHQRVVELSGIVAVAARAANMLGEREALQPFLEALTGALRAFRAPVDSPVSEPMKAPVPPPLHSVAQPEELVRSVWDPELPETIQEASRARALLLELVRRAAHDWVLYRTSRRMDQRELAQDAFIWLFEERPGHARWVIRQEEGRHLTAFLSICSLLDLDANFVRNKVRQMTPHGIKMAGRPAENRYKRGSEVEHYVEHSVELISLEELERYN